MIYLTMRDIILYIETLLDPPLPNGALKEARDNYKSLINNNIDDEQ